MAIRLCPKCHRFTAWVVCSVCGTETVEWVGEGEGDEQERP